jgi:hypothetical protein
MSGGIQAAADWIRNQFFGMMGSLNGYPYNSGVFSAAYLRLQFTQDGASLPDYSTPITVTITLTPVAGSTAGSQGGSSKTSLVAQTGPTTWNVTVNGAWATYVSYDITVEWTFPSSSYAYSVTVPNVAGTAFFSPATPYLIPIAVTATPTPVTASVTVDPGTYTSLWASVSVSSEGKSTIGGGQEIWTGEGQVKFTPGKTGSINIFGTMDLDPATDYVVSITLYTDSGGSPITQQSFFPSGAALAVPSAVLGTIDLTSQTVGKTLATVTLVLDVTVSGGKSVIPTGAKASVTMSSAQNDGTSGPTWGTLFGTTDSKGKASISVPVPADATSYQAVIGSAIVTWTDPSGVSYEGETQSDWDTAQWTQDNTLSMPVVLYPNTPTSNAPSSGTGGGS